MNCGDGNNCPEYLATPAKPLYGVFKAQKVVEIKGEVTGAKDALFRICQ